MKLTDEEKNIIKIMIFNELDYYESKEDYDESDEEFVLKLKSILSKLGRGDK